MLKKSNIIHILALFIMSIFIVYSSESITKATFFPNTALFFYIVGTAVIFLAFVILWMLFNKVHIAFLFCFLIVFLLSCVSYFKFIARGVPLYISDLAYVFKIFGVADSNNIVITSYMVVSFLMAIAMFVLLKRLNFQPVALKKRLLSIFLSSLVLIVFCLLKFNTKSTIVVTGEDYESLNNYLQQIESSITRHIDTTTKPNVIIVLSESFWDIASLKELRFSEEPIPNYKKLTQESISGILNTTTFGGGTANVEFEMQTGFINRFLGTTSTAYESIIKKPTLSLATIFKEQGYRTIAIHTFQKKFYDRDKALPLLGYDEFIGIEDLIDPLYDGSYVSDSVLTDLIIKNYEESQNPVFIFAISMENHQTYPKDKYANVPIKILNEDMPTELKENVETYLTGLHHADRELERLAEYFRQQDEPTTILFFGDHQPTLGPNFGLYAYTNEIADVSNRTTEDFQKLLSSNFLIWSNYKTETDYIPSIGTNFIGNYLLNYINLEKPIFYHFLDEAYKDFHYASRNELFIDSQNNAYGFVPEEYERLLLTYELLQNEMLSGEGDLKERLEKTIHK